MLRKKLFYKKSVTETQRIESIYILPLLGQAAGHSETDLLCVPQLFGQPSEERISQWLSFIVVRHAWSKIPSPSQSTCE